MLGHMQPGEQITSIVGKSEINDFGTGFSPSNVDGSIALYDPNRIVTTIGPKDGCSSYPHLHFECQSPYLPTPLSGQGPNYFGYDDGKLRYGFCENGITPCEQSRNIEMSDFLLSTWVMNKE
jgi:hypothetical protein